MITKAQLDAFNYGIQSVWENDVVEPTDPELLTWFKMGQDEGETARENYENTFWDEEDF